MRQLKNKSGYIFIDADDTLWENEDYFRKSEAEFARLIAPDHDPAEIQRMLWDKQVINIPLYGYGSKTYFMAMTDLAIDLLGQLDREHYDMIREIIYENCHHELTIYEGVEETLAKLSKDFKLVLATKGESVEQLTKFNRSGLAKYFVSAEVMLNKDEADYRKLSETYHVAPEDFVMVGNSVRSDIIPVINLGGYAIYIPHEISWTHEMGVVPNSQKMYNCSHFRELCCIITK